MSALAPCPPGMGAAPSGHHSGPVPACWLRAAAVVVGVVGVAVAAAVVVSVLL